MGCLYLLEGPNGRQYIGITSKTLDERWAAHVQRVKEGRNQALQNAIRKYGAETFTRRVLVIADDWEYLCQLERKAIVSFETLVPKGYNLTAGGEGVVGRVHTELAAANMSVGQKRRFSDPKERQRLIEQGDWKERFPEKFAEANQKRAEKMKTPEMRAKLSAKTQEQFAAPGAREAARKRSTAQWTEEARQAASKRSQDTWGDAEYRTKHSAATKAAMADEEVRARVNAAAKKRQADPAWRKKISESKIGQGKGSTRTEYTKQKMAEARRKRWEDPEYRAKQAAARSRRKSPSASG